MNRNRYPYNLVPVAKASGTPGGGRVGLVSLDMYIIYMYIYAVCFVVDMQGRCGVGGESDVAFPVDDHIH